MGLQVLHTFPRPETCLQGAGLQGQRPASWTYSTSVAVRWKGSPSSVVIQGGSWGEQRTPWKPETRCVHPPARHTRLPGAVLDPVRPCSRAQDSGREEVCIRFVLLQLRAQERKHVTSETTHYYRVSTGRDTRRSHLEIPTAATLPERREAGRQGLASSAALLAPGLCGVRDELWC